ncbi:MerR family transcriptional regulator [Streptomyces virginiae]|uniref:helix-turn-helix domain-containing protein n=1 Tax=Streptomyces virginiae TaxID=1961 RepID=UPI002257654C|nr:MerR family transcriptional regulator [Streptomyces virginiae]MCX4721620.1 MerR family transcriptional regulator [Streptomyces virginiae]
MRIGDAAVAAGTTPRALRFYEERGLLPPPVRTASGQREYGAGEISRVRVIRDLLALGLTIEDLRGCADRLHLLEQDPPPRCGGGAPGAPVPGIVGDRLAALDAEIALLAALRANLARRTAGDGRCPPLSG